MRRILYDLVGIVAVIVALVVGISTFKLSQLSLRAEDSIERIEQNKDAKKEELDRTLKEISRITSSKNSLANKISQLKVKEKKLTGLVKEINSYIELLTAKNAEQEQLLIDIKKEVAMQNALFYIEVQKDPIVTMLESITIHDFFDKMTFFVVQNLILKQRVANVKEMQKGIEIRKAQITEDKLKLEKSIFKAKVQIKELEAEQAILNAQIKQKNSQKTALINEIASLSKKAEEILKKKTTTQPPNNDAGAGGGGNNGGGSGTAPPSSSVGEYTIYYEDGTLIRKVNGPVRLELQSGGYFNVRTGGYKYRGTLEFRKDTNVYVINEILLEDYLKGLGEVPSSWPKDALRAQVVAARSFAIASKNGNKYPGKNYHLLDNVNDQNYVGVGKEQASYGDKWVEAVNETAGEVLKSGDTIITAYYHSSCGGHTLSSQEVWGGNRSYAQAESDRYQDADGNWKGYDDQSGVYIDRGDTNITMTHLKGLINSAIYLKMNNNSKNAQDNVISWNYDKIKNTLGENSIESKIGTIEDIETFHEDESKELKATTKSTKKLLIKGQVGEYYLDAQTFKLAYNIKSPGKNWISSTLFYVRKNSSDNWDFISMGWGHRVGMCQWGAYGRAKLGQNYKNILSVYYRGTSLGTHDNMKVRIGLTKVGGSITKLNATGTFNIVSNGTKVGEVAGNRTIHVVRE